jgi:hypothetical protein
VVLYDKDSGLKIQHEKKRFHNFISRFAMQFGFAVGANGTRRNQTGYRSVSRTLL